ncbi:MAG TPA: ArsB/NhaD family transporter [Plasticicumulans sp.]|uniref:SLC13 family permease n=1 Tax=Plasticicumulans sp. TaxID=2307179 RepID=UPI002D19C52B|nr:ArsB/NhaD family transporter [Plasticicumulans sp.]MBS0603003.1 ArsB/NhaD family transporter [Pseudomonadota bacterium]HMW40750.1 ArsB/NhaD family transporter [Plasticicumulans sp.]HMX52433.1 ArsB/NhaD family transporter [Plasticicumulans sp.]HND97052.1 ArsB/NhaD family transporter [Plasticicumulans sp.]HNG48062.1 ArsB/NhaD family transporter [Plasticicumulans sp.]
MHGEPASVSHVIFGLPPLLVSLAIFVATYAIVISEKLNRAVIAALGAGLMILSGVLTQLEAVHGIDFNTIGLLTAMMVIVAITQKTGVFQYVAIVAAKRVKADPWGLLVMMAVVTAVFSAFLDNVTTVLLVTPVILLITEALGVPPYPYLFTVIFASNIGGTATLIGDPPNIMIGSAANLSFNTFLLHLTPVVLVVFAATLLPIWLVWGRTLRATPEARAQVMAFDEKSAITDPRLLKQALAVIGAVIFGFMIAHPLHLEPATIAGFGAALLLTLQVVRHDAEHQTEEVAHALREIEWVTIFFFVGLFVVVTGIEKAGALKLMADWIVAATQGDYKATAMAILWVSAVLSAVVDNIPFVATMIPVIQNMAPTFGADNLLPLWWALSLGACLGGNGTLVGASANLVVAGFAERAGQPIRFKTFLLMAFPLMLMSIAISTVYLYLRYL